MGRVGLELAAQLGGVHAQVVRLVLVRRAPHLAQQLLAGDQPAEVAGQQLEEGPLRGRQPYVGAAAA